MESESIIDYLNLSGLYPEWDEFSLLVCDICGTIIRPQAFEKHLKTKHQIGVQTASSSPVATADTTASNNSNNTKLQHQKQQQQQISLPKQQLDQPAHQQPNHHPQKITINPPPIALDRKPIITARTVVTTVPNIKPTTITATPAIKTTSNSINKIANGTTNHVLVSSKPVKRSAPSSNISITTTKQTNNLSAGGADAPTSAKTKPKTKTKVTHANSKAQRVIAETNGKGTKNTNATPAASAAVATQPSLSSALGTTTSTLLQTPDGFFDPSFYGLEPLSPPTSAIGGPLSSSSSTSSTISSASSSSSTSSSGSSTNSSLSYCTSLSNHNHHRNVISIPLNGSPHHQPPPTILSKYQDRKWRNTYNVLRDAFF